VSSCHFISSAAQSFGISARFWPTRSLPAEALPDAFWAKAVAAKTNNTNMAQPTMRASLKRMVCISDSFSFDNDLETIYSSGS
jgi:hypothetical protein